jgi:hypothetical protein
MAERLVHRSKWVRIDQLTTPFHHPCTANYGLVPLLAMQVALVRFPYRPDLRLVWKRWLFSVTLRPGARSQALQLRL